jgi:NitT/TauT family transport system ATP-binding protein
MLTVDIRSKVFRTANGGTIQAIAGLKFCVPPRRFACLVGPSGCGKTTTMNAILGLDRDFVGRVRLPDTDGPIGVVFQEPRLLPWRTVEDNVRLVLPAGVDRDIGPLLAELGLGEVRSHFPGELSLGQARRVALARAFAVEPSLLVLDEPFVSLDETTARRLRRLLVKVWEARSTTALMVTHNLAEAVELADEVILLTDQPARVAAIQAIERPRAERTPEFIARMVAEITGGDARSGGAD